MWVSVLALVNTIPSPPPILSFLHKQGVQRHGYHNSMLLRIMMFYVDTLSELLNNTKFEFILRMWQLVAYHCVVIFFKFQISQQDTEIDLFWFLALYILSLIFWIEIATCLSLLSFIYNSACSAESMGWWMPVSIWQGPTTQHAVVEIYMQYSPQLNIAFQLFKYQCICLEVDIIKPWLRKGTNIYEWCMRTDPSQTTLDVRYHTMCLRA